MLESPCPHSPPVVAGNKVIQGIMSFRVPKGGPAIWAFALQR